MLADVNWKSYVCIKLFFLDLADMYNHIKMVLTHTQTLDYTQFVMRQQMEECTYFSAISDTKCYLLI